MDGHSENLPEPRSEPVVAGLTPPDQLETGEVPDSLVVEFSSLTTPYCWVITEDSVAGYDGAAPSAVGKSGPAHAVAGDVTESYALLTTKYYDPVDPQVLLAAASDALAQTAQKHGVTIRPPALRAQSNREATMVQLMPVGSGSTL